MKMMTILAAHHEAVMMTYAWYSDNHRSESLSDGLDDGSPDWNWYGMESNDDCDDDNLVNLWKF